MTANVLKGRCAYDCQRTWHSEHGGALPGGPFPGTGGGPGDVRRCEHGRLWIYKATDHPMDYWRRLSWFWEPITYRRAQAALNAQETR